MRSLRTVLLAHLILLCMGCASHKAAVPTPAPTREAAPLFAMVPTDSVTIDGGHVLIQTDPALTGPGTYPIIQVPASGGYWPNCDNSGQAPILNNADFTCFLNKFAAQADYANADGSVHTPEINVQDFSAYLRSFALGRRDPCRVLRGTPVLPFKPWYECPWPSDPSGFCDHCCPNWGLAWVGTQSPSQAIGIENSYYALTIIPDASGVVEIQCDYVAVLFTRTWRDAAPDFPLPYATWGMTPPPGLRCPWQRTDVVWPHGTPTTGGT